MTVKLRIVDIDKLTIIQPEPGAAERRHAIQVLRMVGYQGSNCKFIFIFKRFLTNLGQPNNHLYR